MSRLMLSMASWFTLSDVADLPTSSLNLDDDGHKVHFPKSDLVGKRIVRSS
jgi:hypothetical protein